MKTLTETYRDAPLEIRFRAPIFHAILVLLSVLSIVIIVNDLASSEKPVTILEHSILVLITILAWWFLRKGHYRRVANFYFSFITIIFLLLRFSRAYTGMNAIPLFALIPGSFLVFGAVFIPDRRFIYGLSGIYAASYAAFVAFLAMSGTVPESDVSVLQQSVYPAIGVLAIAFGLVTIRILFDRVLTSTLDHLNEVRRMSEKARLIASDSAGQLAKADLLLRDSQETANAAVEIEENMHHISDRIVDLDTRIEHAGKAIADVKETAVALNDLSRNQAVQVNQSGASIEEMVASIQNVSRIIEERTAGVRLLTDKAANGQKTVRATITSFGKVSTHMDAIRDMASVIGDIADRTNLLAMNASIQAAHAGEAGRGFAVVAGEIRALAESSSHSASAIAETLAELASSVDETGGTVDSAGRAFGDIVLEIEEFAEAISEIAGNAKELETGSREILDATAELNRITRSVDDQARHGMESQESFAEDVSMVGNISNEITRGTGEIATGISLINKSVGGIHALAVELQERSMSLNRALNDETDS